MSVGPTDKARDFWTRVEEVARTVAMAAVDDALRNLRPGGLTPVACTIDTPVASSTKAAAHIDIPFPGTIKALNFRSTTVGSATLDIKVRRPGQVYADALSIITGGLVFPQIVARTDTELTPNADWTTFIEAGSTVYYFLTAVSGFDALTINLWLHGT